MTPFADDLLAWFDMRRRDLPWRRLRAASDDAEVQRTAYTTWVSEIMLQQTTVDVVAPRFLEFVDRFPSVTALAAAAEEDVVAAWAGLGYYRRARGLWAGARAVVDQFGGRIPSAATDLLSMPGVGPYTAAAIRSLAFGIAHPAIDGNVARVATRLFADDGEPTSASTRKRLEMALLPHVPEDRAGPFTEALIELGALVCRPKSPACDECPVERVCTARARGLTTELPRMKPRVATRPVLSSRAWVERDGALLLVQRPKDASLLPGFYELPGRWGPEGEDPTSVVGEILGGLGFRRVRVDDAIAEARHSITRHRIRSVAVRAEVSGSGAADAEFVAWADLDPERLTTETRKLMRAREAVG